MKGLSFLRASAAALVLALASAPVVVAQDVGTIQKVIQQDFRGPVNVTTRTTGQVLTWNGVAWIASTVSGGGASINPTTSIITIGEGLGAVSQIVGPSDHALTIFSGNTNGVILSGGANGQLEVQSNQVNVLCNGTFGVQTDGSSAYFLQTSNNDVVVNASGSLLAQNATHGFLYAPRCATGAPSGVPQAFTGAGALVIGGDHHLWAELTPGSFAQVDAGGSVGTLAQVLANGTDVGGHSITSSGTITTSKPPLNLAQTWNNSATTFQGLVENVTNTASASLSNLLDLQVGGSSVHTVYATGETTIFTNTAGNPGLYVQTPGGFSIPGGVYNQVDLGVVDTTTAASGVGASIAFGTNMFTGSHWAGAIGVFYDGSSSDNAYLSLGTSNAGNVVERWRVTASTSNVLQSNGAGTIATTGNSNLTLNVGSGEIDFECAALTTGANAILTNNAPGSVTTWCPIKINGTVCWFLVSHN